MKEKRICKRCGTTIIFTNEVELALWESRPGCPACTKTRKQGEGDSPDEAQERDAPEGIAGLYEWMAAERQAVAHLRVRGVITADEADALERELVTAVRTLLDLEPLIPEAYKPSGSSKPPGAKKPPGRLV